MDSVVGILVNSWDVLGQMAPYLLFGFLMAGVLYVLVSAEWVERHLGGRGPMPIIKSALLGVPLPLCSCGVIPVTASIRSHGASRGAATAFLLSTPQTGVDSVFATYALLGPVMAVYRPLAALVTGIVGGSLVSLAGEDAADGNAAGPIAGPACTDDCCADDAQGNRASRALRYAFLTLPRDIAKALVVGILIAGAISALVDKGALASYLGGGLGAMVVMMAVGIPIYVCSTASIPLALGFIHMGASPGAALVFLVAGPATNAAAISVVWKLLGRRTTVVYLVTIAVASLGSGMLFDWLAPQQVAAGGAGVTAHHEHGGGWIEHGSAVVLLGVLTASLLVPVLRRRAAAAEGRETEDTMPQTITLAVTGMTCSHCSNTVTRTLREAPGVTHADVDLEAGRAVVSGEGLDADALAQRITDLGYEASVAQ